MFDRATVNHLVRAASDHHPILLKGLAKQDKGRHDGFRYMEAWKCHPNFRAVVEHCWDQNAPNLAAAMETKTR